MQTADIYYIVFAANTCYTQYVYSTSIYYRKLL